MRLMTNSYGMIKLVCGNHGDDHSIGMQIKLGPSSPFYACPKYYKENRSEEERMCVNRISEVDFEHLLNHLTEMIMDAEDNWTTINLTNYKWKKNGIEYEVLKHSGDELVVKVYNKRAFAK